MIQINDVVVSLDVLQEKFLCNLDACKGECCIEGDAGAPVELDEVMKLEEVLPVIWDELAPEARAVIEKQGVVYTASLLVMTRKDVATVLLKKLSGKEKQISINRYHVIFILFALEITDLIKR